VHNVDYTITVYSDFVEGNLSGELAPPQSGNIAYSGFHIIPLEPSIQISEGEEFYIYLSLSDGGHPYDRTSVVPVLLGSDQKTLVESSASPGESYYMTAKGWEDFYYYDDPSGYQNTGNFCVKAYSVDNPVGLGEYGEGDGPVLNIVNTPNPFNAATNIHYSLQHDSRVEVMVFDLNGRMIEKLAEGYQKAGEHSLVWDSGSIDNGIYICKIIAGGRSASARMILMR